MNNFLYGMWTMWIIVLYVTHREPVDWTAFLVLGLIIPGLLVMVGRGVALLVRWCGFKWERRNCGPL